MLSSQSTFASWCCTLLLTILKAVMTARVVVMDGDDGVGDNSSGDDIVRYCCDGVMADHLNEQLAQIEPALSEEVLSYHFVQ